jgi:hypothetical protein
MTRLELKSRGVFFFIFILLCSIFPVGQHMPILEESIEFETQGRAQTVWSGTQNLNSNYYIGIADELIIQSCTTVSFDGGVRIYVDGRITIEGTTTCPVVFQASSTATSGHEGIQFNSTSYGRGSVIQNLTISNSVYGITIYGSNPVIANLTLNNPQRVGIDMFNFASPQLKNIIINEAGQNVPFQNDWRYGLGISVGAGSSPIIDQATISNVQTRALNIWGSSGGLFRNLTIDNASGSNWVAAAGIWVEDSQPLLTDVQIDKSDTGIIIRHITDGGYTRAVVKNAVISNSMFRGVYVDKNDHSNYTNYETADFTNLTIIGTGTSGAKTPGIAFAALEVNATGAWFENTLVENSDAVGVRLYFVDSSTTFRNLTIRDSGESGAGAHEAGLSVSSTFFAPHFDGLEISGSVGSGIFAASGGAMQGTSWYLHNNTKHGFELTRSSVIVDGMTVENNGFSGARVDDSRAVEFFNLTSQFNGALGSSAIESSGIVYTKSNDLESSSGDVRCQSCVFRNNARHEIYSEDSVDLWLEQISVESLNMNDPAMVFDNTGLTLSSQRGQFHLSNIDIHQERNFLTGQPALLIVGAAAIIDGLEFSGNHSGMFWDGSNNGNLPSSISNANFSGFDCAEFENHSYLSGMYNSWSSTCLGGLSFVDSNVNWSYATDYSQTTPLSLVRSQVRFHESTDIAYSTAAYLENSYIDVAHDLMIWVQNNYSNGIPYAYTSTEFNQFNVNATLWTSELGTVELNNYVSSRWSTLGNSGATTVTVDCGFDGVSNSTSQLFQQSMIMYCILPIENQPPYLRWASPLEDSIHPSNAEVLFNASGTFDIDDDALTFSWTSSIDGDILSSCTGSWTYPNGPEHGVSFIANGNDAFNCSLSDGIHLITLEVCDDTGQCVNASRLIELVNTPPILVYEFNPSLDAWNELVMPQTGTLTINTSGTYDPEGDPIACMISFTGYNRQGPGWSNAWVCPEELGWNFDHVDDDPPPVFQLHVTVWDIAGNVVEFTTNVRLYNEIPEPMFSLQRDSNLSESLITFDGSLTVDPEGDGLEITYSSNLDGTLAVLEDGTTSWSGYLSRGVHIITMQVQDDRPEHVNQSRTISQLVTVENSPPLAVIEPFEMASYDSSELIWFSSNGSGDFDSACDTFPIDGQFHCAPFEPASGSEFLIVTWTSDLDGRLTPEGEDWLYFDGRLSAGTHTITLSVDDGIHEPVTATTQVTITPSAPVIRISTPENGEGFLSSDSILLDLRESRDYDNDEFTFSLRSNLLTEPILLNSSTASIHSIQLGHGTHVLTILAIDSTGMERTESIEITIFESDPIAKIEQPTNRMSISPGGDIILEEASIDADNDLVQREWRLWNSSSGQYQVISTNSIDTITGYAPGEYHISLYVEDSRGRYDEQHVNITLQSSVPRFDQDSLDISSMKFITGEKSIIKVSIILFDADGTTKDVRMNITFGMQNWEAQMQPTGVDNRWEGSIEWIPQKEGLPFLKIIATDGEGQNANVDIISRTLSVEDGEDSSFRTILVAVGSGLILTFLIVMFVLKRRAKLADIDSMISWEAFRNPQPQKEVPELDNAETDEDEILPAMVDLDDL